MPRATTSWSCLYRGRGFFEPGSPAGIVSASLQMIPQCFQAALAMARPCHTRTRSRRVVRQSRIGALDHCECADGGDARCRSRVVRAPSIRPMACLVRVSRIVVFPLRSATCLARKPLPLGKRALGLRPHGRTSCEESSEHPAILSAFGLVRVGAVWRGTPRLADSSRADRIPIELLTERPSRHRKPGRIYHRPRSGR
jgi:hypothetical protein